jgi:hypothetical protein
MAGIIVGTGFMALNVGRWVIFSSRISGTSWKRALVTVISFAERISFKSSDQASQDGEGPEPETSVLKKWMWSHKFLWHTFKSSLKIRWHVSYMGASFRPSPKCYCLCFRWIFFRMFSSVRHEVTIFDQILVTPFSRKSLEESVLSRQNFHPKFFNYFKCIQWNFIQFKTHLKTDALSIKSLQNHVLNLHKNMNTHWEVK